MYQVRRTAITTVAHSSLPLLYCIGLLFLDQHLSMVFIIRMDKHHMNKDHSVSFPVDSFIVGVLTAYFSSWINSGAILVSSRLAESST